VPEVAAKPGGEPLP